MKAERFTAGMFIFVICALMLLVLFSIGSRAKELTDNPKIIIEWEKIYPFEDGIKKVAEASPSKISPLYNYVKDKMQEYTSVKMSCYKNFVEYTKKYENILGWNMVSVFDYNPVVKLKDGYLTGYTMSLDVTHNAEAVKDFADFCAKRGISFAYINFPTKICKSEDKEISGVLDFSNQNADKFLALLKESGVRNYDFRENLHAEGMNHHEAFFVTDHHWKPETGLWAARHILEILRDDLSWDIEPEILRPENFEYVKYHDWFLGSQGKKLMHINTKPDDFTMIYPKFATYLKFEIPGLGLNVLGDFKITYDMKATEKRDYYGKNPHNAYMHGRQPLLRIENMLAKNQNRILVIYDSFSNSVIPFLSLGVHHTDAIDLRQFTGSLRNFIETLKPDVVIIEYYTEMPGESPATEAGNKIYDFR